MVLGGVTNFQMSQTVEWPLISGGPMNGTSDRFYCISMSPRNSSFHGTNLLKALNFCGGLTIFTDTVGLWVRKYAYAPNASAKFTGGDVSNEPWGSA